MIVEQEANLSEKAILSDFDRKVLSAFTTTNFKKKLTDAKKGAVKWHHCHHNFLLQENHPIPFLEMNWWGVAMTL